MDMQNDPSLDVNGHEASNGTDDSKVNQRKQSNTPYALHVGDNKENSKGANKAASENFESAHTENQQNLKAPYAQPVLDASKLKRSNVDERIALVRERRLQNQQAFEREANIRKVRDELALAKWEQSQNERRKKMEENKEKEENRRKEVELRKKQRLDEDKKKAEAIVARTDQQATVVLRRKRTASTDRTKRWSWGAGGYGGGGGGFAYATSVDTAPGPFHYLDANRMTKHQPSSGLIGSARSQVVTSSCFDLSQLTDGDDDKPSSSSTTTGPFGFGSPSASSSSSSQQQDSRFSKSPLLLSTAHMTFASGLRSYDSSPVSNSSKPSSPASTPRSVRSRSSDTRTKSRKGNSQGSITGVDGKLQKKSPRGRSPAARQSESLKRPKAGNNSSPQLTEPVSLSSRLLAPTRASLARSKQADSEESTPVRSRSIDRKTTIERPTSGRSDTSSSSHSPRMSASTTPKSRPIGRTPSPSLHKAKSSKPDVQYSSSPNLAQATPGESPQLRTGARRAPSPASGRSSLNSQSSSGKSSRWVSPARQSPISSRPSSSGSKRTPIRTDAGGQSSKSTPPVIKQTLRPSPASSRPKSSFSPSVIIKSKPEKKEKVPSKTKPKQPVPKLALSVKENQPDAAARKNPKENTEKVEDHQVPENIPNAENQVEKSRDVDAPEGILQTADAPVVVDQENSLKDIKNTEASLPAALIASEVASSEVNEEREVHHNVHEDEAPTTSADQYLHQESSDSANLVSTPSTERLEKEVLPAPDNLHVEEKSSHLVNLEETLVERLEQGETEDLPTQEESIIDPETDKAKSYIEVQNNAEPTMPLESQDVQKVHQSSNHEPSGDINQQDKEQETTQLEDSLDEEDHDHDKADYENDKIATKDKANIVSSSTDNETLTQPILKDQKELVLEESTTDSTDICVTVNDDKPAAQEEAVNDDKPVTLNDDKPAAQEETPSPVVEISPEIVETPAVQQVDLPVKPVVEPAPIPAETKKKERKLTPEEQAYKEAMATKRREAKEKREKEELERQERKKLEAEERNRRVEIARQMAEEARLEEEKRVEEEQKQLAEERRIQEEEELKKKLELEEQNRKHEEFLREQKEKIEQRAKEEAEKARKEREAAAQKKEEERLQRKKRLEMIMRRTRGGESPTPGATNSSSTPSGDSSPANVTPTGGRSPQNSITPDRVVSPVTVDSPPALADGSSNHAEETQQDNSQAPISAAYPTEDGDHTEASEIPTIEMPPESTTVGQSAPSPVEAFEQAAQNACEDHQLVPNAEHNGKTFDALLDCDKVPMNGTDGENHDGFAENPFVKVPTANLVEF